MKKTGSISPIIPRGLRDILPLEAAERLYLDSVIRKVFALWSYGEVITPAFEFYDALSTDAGEALKKDMFSFFDTDGSQLALRPEMTIPIARLASQRLKNEAGPHRLSYITNVYREEPAHRGQAREFTQGGIELIGANSDTADTEVLSILIEILNVAGLETFQIGVGHVGFLRSVFESFKIAGELQRKLEEMISLRNIVGFKKLLELSELNIEIKDLLIKIVTLRGVNALREVEELPLSDECLRELSSLKKLLTNLTDLGFEDRVIVDFGIIRDFDYYSGIIFEAYCSELGFLLGGGGRYDNLLADFGYPVPAAGFALGIERLHIALLEQGANFPTPASKYLVYSKNPVAAMKKAKALRSEGKMAEVFLEKGDKASIIKYAESKDFSEIIEV